VQKRNGAPTSAPQLGQRRDTGVPHAWQNFLPSISSL
jgi:hypothetical protein